MREAYFRGAAPGAVCSRNDRSTKLALYARSGVQAYWIVDVQDRSIVVFGEPSGETYRQERRYRSGERIALGAAGSPLALLTLDVDEALGAPTGGEPGGRREG